MKTWRQLEAMAKRQEISVHHGDRGFRMIKEGSSIAEGESWGGSSRDASKVMRAMCEAALREMGRAK